MDNKTLINLTDQELVDKVLSGDTNAFEAIINKTERLVAQIVFKMVNNTEDRKDIAQDIYLKTFKNLDGFRFQSKLSTWIGRISYNTCLHYLDKKKLTSLSLISFENDEADNLEFQEISNKTINGSYAEAELLIFQQELSEILKSELEALPPVFKTIITLYHNEELSYSEIAEITGLPEGTLKSYLFRARKTMKKNLLNKYKRETL